MADELWKYWFSIIDSQTTIICADADGQTRQQHELFDTMAGSMEGPPAHFGCRSMVDYWVKGQSPVARGRGQVELARRAKRNPEKFLKDVKRNAKLRPPGTQQAKTPVRRLVRTTRQRRANRATIKRVEANVNRQMRLGRDTQSLHRDPTSGKWNLRMKDRPDMHNRLIHKLDKAKGGSARGTQIEQGREAVIVSGLPEAGTEQALRAIGLDPTKYLAPNVDDFAQALNATGRMPRWAGLSRMEKSALLHDEAAYLERRLAQRAMRRGTNLVLESDGNAAHLEARIAALRAEGYNVRMVHVDVDVWTSTQRTVEASLRNERFYPIDRIEKAWDPIYGSAQRRAAEEMKELVDGWIMFDNEVGLVEMARSVTSGSVTR